METPKQGTPRIEWEYNRNVPGSSFSYACGCLFGVPILLPLHVVQGIGFRFGKESVQLPSGVFTKGPSILGLRQ